MKRKPARPGILPPEGVPAPRTAYHSDSVGTPFLKHLLGRGARVAARPEAPSLDAPLTFGDVPAEYRAGREGAALFDATDRGRLFVSGGDAASFLHRLLANDVRGLGPGEGNRNLLLSPKGKVLFDFDLTVEAERIVLSTHPGTAEALAAALDTYLFSEDVTIEDTSQDHRPLELAGPAAGEVASVLFGGGPLPTALHRSRELLWNATAVQVTALRTAGVMGLRLDAGDQAETLWNALEGAGATPAGLAARDMLRVEQGAALFGVDVDENVYPQEARLEEAFSLEKGCYIGQEVVAKIDTYGGLNKRLCALAVSGDDPVPRGTRLLGVGDDDGRELGLVTSWAWSFALEAGCCLAYVKRRHQGEGTRFRFGETGLEGVLVGLPVG